MESKKTRLIKKQTKSRTRPINTENKLRVTRGVGGAQVGEAVLRWKGRWVKMQVVCAVDSGIAFSYVGFYSFVRSDGAIF